MSQIFKLQSKVQFIFNMFTRCANTSIVRSPKFLYINKICLHSQILKSKNTSLIRQKCVVDYPKVCSISHRLFSKSTNIENLVVNFEQVKNAISKKDSIIIDVREPEEIKELGKIPNSINIPLGNVSAVLSNMTDKEFEKFYNRQKPTEDTEIIFYCMIGKRSGMAQQNAINLGYKNAKNYLGSWTEWASKTR